MTVWHRQFLTYHPVIGWWYIPNLKALIAYREHRYFIKTNSIGMRSGREYALTRPEGRHRIVLLGDSYAAGVGLNNNERFSDLLEKSNPKLDVLNFGLPGSGTDQQQLVYESMARSFEVDAYIWAITPSNIVRNQLEIFPITRPTFRDSGYRPKPFFSLDGDRLVLHNQPVPKELISEQKIANRIGSKFAQELAQEPVLAKVPQWLRRMGIVRKLAAALEQSYRGYDSDKSASWRLMRAIIQRFFDQAEGKPVFVVPLPTPHHFLWGMAPTYLERLESLADSSKLRFVVDILPYFRELSDSELDECCLYPDLDPHYSTKGNRIVADAISDILASNCPELLG